MPVTLNSTGKSSSASLMCALIPSQNALIIFRSSDSMLSANCLATV